METPDYADLFAKRLASKSRPTGRAPICLDTDAWEGLIEARTELDQVEGRVMSLKMNEQHPVAAAKERLKLAEARVRENSIHIVLEGRTSAENDAIAARCITKNDDDNEPQFDMSMFSRELVKACIVRAETLDGEPLPIQLEQLHDMVDICTAGELGALKAVANTSTAGVDFPTLRK